MGFLASGFRVGPSVKDWSVVPFEATSPLALQIDNPGRHGYQLLLRRVGANIPFTKAFIDLKVHVDVPMELVGMKQQVTV